MNARSADVFRGGERAPAPPADSRGAGATVRALARFSYRAVESSAAVSSLWARMMESAISVLWLLWFSRVRWV